MSIRRANALDLPKIMELERICYPNPWPEVLLKSHLGEKGFMLYEAQEQIVAYMIIGIKIPTLFQRLEKRTRSLAGQSVEWDEQTGHLMNIAVDPQFRGQGIAKALMNEGIEFLTSLRATSIELEVRLDNHEAIQLYEQYDFKTIRIIRNYYQDGEDAYLMRKDLWHF